VTLEDELSEQSRPPGNSERLRLPDLSGRSRELLETLDREAGRAGQFYEGALRALADRANPVRAEIAAYALRELIEELERAALAPAKGPTLGDLLAVLRATWEEAERRPGDRGLLDAGDPAILAVDRFLDDAARGHRSRRDRAQITFTGLDPVGREGPPDTHEARIKALLDFREDFNTELHGEDATDPAAFEAQVEGFERFLLDWLRPRTFTDFDAIDALPGSGPAEMSTEERTAAVKLIRAGEANLEYFFSSQEDASWLPFLLEEGFFENPAEPETVETDDGQTGTRYPYWPESRYLARIATEAPEPAFAAVCRIPDTTSPRVHQDIAAVACRLPGEFAAELATREGRWLAGYEGHLVSYPPAAGELIAHLAKEGEVAAAFKLAGTLLKVSAAPAPEGRGRRRVRSLLGDREYGEILEAAWPSMMEADPERSFRFLCHRLSAVTRIEFGGSGFDPTYMWRAAIENHARNTRHGYLDSLVDAIRDSAVASAEIGLDGLEIALTELARHDGPIFRRLALFVLARFGTAEQVAEALTEDGQIDDFNVWHEYAELLKTRFGSLGRDRQERIIALISAGPERELTASQQERGLNEEQVEVRRRYWGLERYALIEDELGGEAKAAYEALVSEFGKPEHPTFRSVVTIWTGTTSPHTTEELLDKGPAGALEALRAWIPEEGPEGRSSEGLVHALEAAIEKEPAGFAAIATHFADLEPEHVRGLLRGLAKAAREQVMFPWKGVLDLCEQVTAESPADVEIESEARPAGLTTAIIGLVSDGLEQGEGGIPSGERARVWRLIEPHLDDPDPSPRREEGKDPATVAINSVRGEAVHAAIRYGLWVERALGAAGGLEGIASLPELAAAIDRRLDPAVDPSLAIRAVLGQWFVQFVRMDGGWAESLVARLFPPDPGSAERFSAAWNAYVVFNQPRIPMFKILARSYELAAERFEEVDEDLYIAGNPREHLAEHLFFFRFVGSIDLADDGIFARFWAIAPTAVRTHVLRDVGWSLEHGDPEMSEEVRARFTETWEWIFAHGQEDPASLVAFGAWFGAPQLEAGWLLARGREVLELGRQLDPDHPVFQAAARMAGDHPAEVVEVLRLMIVTDAEGWGVQGSTAEVREALSAILAGGQGAVHGEAVAVVHLLGGRGFSEFRDLLSPGGRGS
jgi:hypothetical protein